MVSAENRRKVYDYLFKEGTIVVKKNVHGGDFSSELPVRNLEVMKLLQSLASMQWVTATFNWGYFYYILTDKGITELRKYLGIGEEIFPATMAVAVTDINTLLKRTPRPERTDRPAGDRKFAGGRGFNAERGGERRPRPAGDRPAYRKRE